MEDARVGGSLGDAPLEGKTATGAAPQHGTTQHITMQNKTVLKGMLNETKPRNTTQTLRRLFLRMRP